MLDLECDERDEWEEERDLLPVPSSEPAMFTSLACTPDNLNEIIINNIETLNKTWDH